MKPITKYQSDDGKEFSNEADCRMHETTLAEVERIMSALPGLPLSIDSCDFANGAGYIQHTGEAFHAARLALLKLMQPLIGHRWVQNSIDRTDTHPSYVGRLLGDSGLTAFEKAWYRISCTDKQFREWGQSYYAGNPEAAKQVRLNP